MVNKVPNKELRNSNNARRHYKSNEIRGAKPREENNQWHNSACIASLKDLSKKVDVKQSKGYIDSDRGIGSEPNRNFQDAINPINSLGVTDGQNAVDMQQSNPYGRRGLILLNKSFKDCARPSPPPSSDINFWPSLSSDKSQNESGAAAGLFDTSNKTKPAKTKAKASTVWDQRMRQRSHTSQNLSLDNHSFNKSRMQNEKREEKEVVDWFENSGSADNYLRDQNSKDREIQSSTKIIKNNSNEAKYTPLSHDCLLDEKKSPKSHYSSSGLQNVRHSHSHTEKLHVEEMGDTDNHGWSIVKRKVDRSQGTKENRKIKHELDKSHKLNESKSKPQISSENIHKRTDMKESGDANVKKEQVSREDSEKARNRQMKKVQKKEKRRFERETQVILRRERAKRDTKVCFISAIDDNRAIDDSKKSNYSTNSQFNYSYADKPQEQTTNKTVDTRSSNHLFKNSKSNLEDSYFSYASRVAASSKAFQSYRPAVSSKVASKGQSSSRSKMIHKPPEEKEKRNVRSRDPITFDLLAVAKRPEQKKPKTVRSLGHQLTKEKPLLKRGKVRENAKKTLTVLKKNMLAERRARKEQLIAFLQEQIIVEYKRSLKRRPQPSLEDSNSKMNEEGNECSSPSPSELRKYSNDRHEGSSPPAIPLDKPKIHSSNASFDRENPPKIKEPDPKSIALASNCQKENINMVTEKMSKISVDSSKAEVIDLPNQSCIVVSDEMSKGKSREVIASKWEKPEYSSQISESRIAKYKDLGSWHPDILVELGTLDSPIHGTKFREYCDHLVNSDVNSSLKEFLQAVVTLQYNHYKRDPIKAKIRQRYYCGLKETSKHMNHMSCIVIAPDIKRGPGPGSLDELVFKVVNQAKQTGVQLIFGLNLRQLRRITIRKSYVSCIGIVNYDGAQEKFATLLNHVSEARKMYNDLLLRHRQIFKQDIQKP